MRTPFIKMHGLGNDFVILDAREAALPGIKAAKVRAIADRNCGIGCDQLIVLEPADNAENAENADFIMRIYNADGAEVEACGNASRAVAVLHGTPATVATGGGILHLEPVSGGASVDMGQPRFGWEEIPLGFAMDTLDLPLGWSCELDTLENPVAVNIGNPHAIFFVEDCDQVDLAKIGPVIEHDPAFPQRVNVNIATVENAHHIRLRVWERGAGLTQACGTGACATAVAAIRRQLARSPVTVELPGGALKITWQEGGSIRMTGPAQESFRGSFAWDDLG